MPWIPLLLFLLGFHFSLFAPAAQTWIRRLVPPQDLEEAFGRLRISYNLGLLVGFGLGEWVYRLVPALVFEGDALWMAAAALIVWPVSAAIRSAEGGQRDGLGRGGLGLRSWSFLLIYAVISMVYGQLYWVVPLLLARRGAPAWVFAALAVENTLLVVLLQRTVITRVEKANRKRWAVPLGVLFYGAGFWGIGIARGSLVGLGAAVLVVTIGEMLVVPGAAAWVARSTSVERVGQNLGWLHLANRMGVMLAPAVGAALLSLGTRGWRTAIGGVAVAAALAFLSL